MRADRANRHILAADSAFVFVRPACVCLLNPEFNQAVRLNALRQFDANAVGVGSTKELALDLPFCQLNFMMQPRDGSPAEIDESNLEAQQGRGSQFICDRHIIGRWFLAPRCWLLQWIGRDIERHRSTQDLVLSL